MQVTYIGHQRPSKNPSINWYICKISTTDIADTWHNNVGHSLAHEHRQGHVISRILSIGMRMQGIFGSCVRVWTWIWRKTSSCLWLNNQLDGSVITTAK